MKIAIGCSIRYRKIIDQVIKDLRAIDVDPLFSNLDDIKEESLTIARKKHLALEHYKAINEADAYYIITPGGYMGTSCKTELGYALALNKPIYFFEPTNDEALDCYVTKFIPVDQLQLFKSIV